MVGSGKGSFAMRGQQLGAALGARVVNAPTPADWCWADVAVLIKRAALAHAKAARLAGVSVIWDALDFWRQPADNDKSESDARQLLASHVRDIAPILSIGATRAMADALGGVYLPHHTWPGLTGSPVRSVVEVVGYEGNASYLGTWRKALERACARRGWRLVINPPDLRDLDIIVALRDGQWDGWMCREWKSGVKIGNAIAAGRPLITQASAAQRELAPVGTLIETVEELEGALDVWSPAAARALALRQSSAASLTLPSVAADYRILLERATGRSAFGVSPEALCLA